ncbi:fumarylacetoacetate hydrolase family protein [Paraburkholderia phenoliruptrix]|uniref:fumarylacetoacetate hydrolase family protein n=1 Tax=Paraburkholderia phenoliruptrix TaxID=252970 RepID=UPI001C6EF977|nr:fumarylacetoacetate hydrolase family protein [Paraburkholderia phenoliruptrix]MBW9107410.1 fumarylacetoacetate hydrolase family protein [Paraburkholderia phenoliruptrix]MBW9128168.1 fumarylacetoacetate hydrolase family protein [Paraburkholderia ginsengiterrae]
MFKLANYSQPGARRFPGMVLETGEILNIPEIASRESARSRLFEKLAACACIDDLLLEWDESFEALVELATLYSDGKLEKASVDSNDLSIAAPVSRPGKLVCHAQNYADHVMEMRRSQFGVTNVDLSKDFMGEKSKTWPYAFLKAPSAIVGPYDDIELPDGHPQIDWEAEMAVVIGRRGKRITEGSAMAHVAGLVTFNDVSCRDNQWRPDRVTLRSDWFAAKSFDSFAPTGPYLVPIAFVKNYMDLRITLKVNGEVMQDGSTAGLIFSPEEQISFFSKSMTWFPGDVLATGTPAGTGQGLGRYLSPGDIVETEIEGLGAQKNRCVPQPVETSTL